MSGLHHMSSPPTMPGGSRVWQAPSSVPSGILQCRRRSRGIKDRETRRSETASGRCASAALLMARWGVVPAWSRDLSPGAGMINAPAEALEEKPAYRTALQSQRCLVPANGFYEWQARGTKKQPYKITLRHGALVAFAGLWARWAPEEGDAVETFT